MNSSFFHCTVVANRDETRTGHQFVSVGPLSVAVLRLLVGSDCRGKKLMVGGGYRENVRWLIVRVNEEHQYASGILVGGNTIFLRRPKRTEK